MKRSTIALATVAVAIIATVGVVHATGDSDSAKPSKFEDRGQGVSQDVGRQKLAEQGKQQARQMQIAQDALQRGMADYAKKHPTKP
jgi:hypothetical protein